MQDRAAQDKTRLRLAPPNGMARGLCSWSGAAGAKQLCISRLTRVMHAGTLVACAIRQTCMESSDSSDMHGGAPCRRCSAASCPSAPNLAGSFLRDARETSHP
eukprot:6178103-Pleurochrysis_carterae.AAC.1